MVKLSIGPLHCVMTLFTGIGKARVRHRTRRAGEILLVTSETGAGGQVVVVVDVAIDAQPGWDCMPPGQEKSSRAVVKLGVQPVVCGVTALAISRELGGNVVRVGSRLKVC